LNDILFNKKPSAIQVVINIIKGWYILSTISMSLVFIVLIERYFLFPGYYDFFTSFIITAFLVIIANFMDPIGPIIVVGRLLGEKISIKDRGKKLKIHGKRIPINVMITSFIPFGAVLFLISFIFKVWENFGFSLIIWSIVVSLYFIITNLRYGEIQKK
jgi:hypothetical protein